MSEQEQQVEQQQVEQPQQNYGRNNAGNQFINQVQGVARDYSDLSRQLSQKGREYGTTVLKATGDVMGGDTLKQETKEGKITIYIFWGLCVIILIYIIVIAVWANKWFSSYVCVDETAEVKTYIYKDDENKEYEYTATFQDNFMRALNVNKLIINCLFSVTALYGMIIFYLSGVGSGIKDGVDREGNPINLPVCGGKNFAWYLIILLVWLILNCVWDMQHNTRYPAPVEGFCGMVETFCGNISESFSNMKKALRKF